MSPEETSPPTLAVERKSANVLLVRLSGNWRSQSALPGLEAVQQALQEGGPAKAVELDAVRLEGWDSRFLTFLTKCHDFCRARGLEFRGDQLPEGVRRLLRLANVVPEKTDTRRSEVKAAWLARVGSRAIEGW